MPRTGRVYTVVGSTRAPERSRIGLLVVNRSSRINREAYLASIARNGFSEVMLVEPQANSYTVEALVRDHPKFRFLLLEREINAGEQINAALSEMSSEYVLVVWSTMVPARITSNALAKAGEWRAVVVSPLLRNENGGVIPSVVVPRVNRRTLRVEVQEPRVDGTASLFPSDFAGLYDRARYLDIGGYDGRIDHPFWQKMDFGMRAHQWGERICLHTGIRIDYRTPPEPEDQTPDGGYALFFAKCLAVRVRSDGGFLPWTEAIRLAVGLRRGVLGSRGTVRDVRRWIDANRERFLKEARSVVRDWSERIA